LFDKILDRRWLTRDQPVNVPDRHLDERRIIEALRRTCADCKNKSAPRQSAPPIRFARRFLLSTKLRRVGSFIATRPIVARRVLTRRSLRNNRTVILSGAKRSRRIPRKFTLSHATGFLDCARNDEFQMLVAYLSGRIDSVE
jgi:hypothetical protein